MKKTQNRLPTIEVQFISLRLIEMNLPELKDYYASKRWELRKKAYFLKHAKRCCQCHGWSSVQLHHKTYRNLGNEPDEDLEPMCFDCHRKIHKEMTKEVSHERRARKPVMVYMHGKPKKVRDVAPRNRRFNLSEEDE